MENGVERIKNIFFQTRYSRISSQPLVDFFFDFEKFVDNFSALAARL